MMMYPVYVLVNGLGVLREVAVNKPHVEEKVNRLVAHLNMIVDDMIDIIDEIHKMINTGQLTDSELEAMYFAFFPEGQETDIHDVLDYAKGLFLSVPNDQMGNKLKVLLNKMHRLAGLIYSWYHDKHGFTENISLDEI